MRPDEWQEVRLGEALTVKHGFAFKGEFFSDQGPGDILITPGNFDIGGGFKATKLKYYSGPEEAAYVLSGGDMIVTMTDLSRAGDTLGYPARVPTDGRRYLHNQRIGKVAVHDKAVLDEDFLYWRLRVADYRHYIVSAATGSTVSRRVRREV